LFSSSDPKASLSRFSKDEVRRQQVQLKNKLLSLVINDRVDCFTAGDATHASREKIDLGLSGLLSK
jgi:hypothetical protein